MSDMFVSYKRYPTGVDDGTYNMLSFKDTMKYEYLLFTNDKLFEDVSKLKRNMGRISLIFYPLGIIIPIIMLICGHSTRG